MILRIEFGSSMPSEFGARRARLDARILNRFIDELGVNVSLNGDRDSLYCDFDCDRDIACAMINIVIDEEGKFGAEVGSLTPASPILVVFGDEEAGDAQLLHEEFAELCKFGSLTIEENY